MNWKNILNIIVGNFGKSDSVIGKYNKKDALKTLRTATLAGVGAFAAHWFGFFEGADWGLLETLVVAGITAGLEGLQRFLKNNEE